MRLHMKVLFFDLMEYHPKERILKDDGILDLRCATILSEDESTRLYDDKVYVVTSEQAEDLLKSKPRAKLSLVVAGELPEDLLDSQYDLIWIESGAELPEVLDLLIDRFAFYSEWESNIHRALSRNMPLRTVADLSQPVFRHPIWLWDSLYQTVFMSVSPSLYDVPDYFQRMHDASPWPVDQLNLIDEDFIAAKRCRSVHYLRAVEGYPYRDLCYNIYIDDEYAATLTLEEIGEPFNERDEILLTVFAHLIKGGIEYSKEVNTNSTIIALMQIERLLSGERVASVDLSRAIAGKGWAIENDYLCMVASPHAETYPERTLMAAAKQVSFDRKAMFYTSFGGSIVIICNLEIADEDGDAIARQIFEKLLSLHLDIEFGVSTLFDNLLDLPYFYDQCLCAIRYGSRHEEEGRYHLFADHILESIVRRCLQGTIPEALQPPGIRLLERYDTEYDSELVKTLFSYLDNDLSTKTTAEALYVHRNTLLARLKRIQQVSGFDFEDKDTRFLIQISLLLEEWDKHL